MELALRQAAYRQRMMALDHPTAAAANHGQWQFKVRGRRWTGVRQIAVDVDFCGRIKTQAQPFGTRLQAMLQIGIQALGIEMTKQ
ncbi:hypothetical protein D3C77_729910 [compost metagenome]